MKDLGGSAFSLQNCWFCYFALLGGGTFKQCLLVGYIAVNNNLFLFVLYFSYMEQKFVPNHAVMPRYIYITVQMCKYSALQ